MVPDFETFDDINNPFMIEQKKASVLSSMPSNHYHDCYEIYYLLSGERYYFIKDRTYHITKGNLVLINAYELHRTLLADAPDHERILINFKNEFIVVTDPDLDLFDCFRSGVHILNPGISGQLWVETLLFKLLEEDRKRLPGFHTYLKVLLTELLIFINRQAAFATAGNAEHPSSVHKKISEIVRFINMNYQHNLPLALISEKFFINTYYLSRIFKKITGFSFIEYLNHVRTKEAQRYLRETRWNVTQISEKVGFESISHFGRVFKRITGYSPLKYRKIHK